MKTPSKLRGPIYGLLDLEEPLEKLRASSFRQSQASRLHFVTMRMLMPAIALCVTVLIRQFGILPDLLARWLVMAVMLGTACVFVATIRDLRRWRQRRSPHSCSPLP